MNALVTGGAGFLGSHLCDLLISKGYDVICLDNCITGDKQNIENIETDRFSYIKHDVIEPLHIDGKIDYIFHLASPASPIDYLNLPIETMTAGSCGTLNMLNLARDKGARLLLASTSEVYGDPCVHPQTEEYWGNVNPIGPRSVYDESKRFAEALTMAYHRHYETDVRIARIFNTYGPRMRINDGRVIPNFIRQALHDEHITIYGDGTQTRSFCYVSDEIKGLYSLMKSNYVLPMNIGNPDEYNMIEIANMIRLLIGSRSRIIYKDLPIDDPRQRKPDITKARTILGWEPKVSLEDGLKETISYFKNILQIN